MLGRMIVNSGRFSRFGLRDGWVRLPGSRQAGSNATWTCCRHLVDWSIRADCCGRVTRHLEVAQGSKRGLARRAPRRRIANPPQLAKLPHKSRVPRSACPGRVRDIV